MSTLNSTLRNAGVFRPLGSTRLFILGGMTLILGGMVFGDIFAVFVLHQNAGQIAEHLLAATQAVAAGDVGALRAHFTSIGGFLENRGTKVDTHVHILDFGYLALLLALLEPYVALSALVKKGLAQIFLIGALLLPVSVFLIHYVGLASSPLPTIGWASIFADFGGLLVIVACVGELAGLGRYLGGSRPSGAREVLLEDRSWPARALLTGGTSLVLVGFLGGAYYAAVDLAQHEAKDTALLRAMMESASQDNLAQATQAVDAYGGLQGEKAVKIAAHAHIIEFGLLAILLA
ncbi:MAG TPA: hypothetical protein VKE24_05165, partial [Candidatus Acidoferrales bacterium]|nr:hypothetical protein [Candidatus Acidoferrales bacterium]